MSRDGVIFLAGSCAYPTLEMAWRGHTHYSMALAGGVCLCLIDRVCCGQLKNRSLFLRCLAGAGLITGVELAAGVVVNGVFNLKVWDYSNMPLNVLGQVCLPYSALWFLLTLPAMALCGLCRKSPLLED
ncbi:putative ABC transporter permease [Acutalibacter intestini]|uniref:putative ABC transporter permease n=1 Tax=Acutalibacter intestini TaxID=3093659 RepID=UPI002AC9136D|nr:hypothetical protein [Acutalibacter sp. M00204]